MAEGVGGQDAVAAYSFWVDIGGVVVAQFKEMTGATSEVSIIEQREVGSKGGLPFISKIPGSHKWGDLTLKKGKTKSMGLWEWIKQVQNGDIKGARRDGSIVLYDTQQNEVARFNFRQGWPSKVSVGSLKADGNEILLEECTITHTGLTFS